VEGLSADQGDDARREAEGERSGPRGLDRGRLLKRALPVAILAAAGAAVALMVATKPEIPRKPVEERVWLVSAVTAKRSAVRPELRLYGEVVAAREAQLRPLVAGPVVEIGPNFEDGGTVRRGELLLAIDPFEFRSAVTEAEAQAAEAKAHLRELKSDLAGERKALEQDRALIELRRRDVERAQALRAKGSGTQKSLDDARLALAQQEQQLIAREQGIAGLEARIAQQVAAIQRLEVALARAERDPPDGGAVAIPEQPGRLPGIRERFERIAIHPPAARPLGHGQRAAAAVVHAPAIARDAAASGVEERLEVRPSVRCKRMYREIHGIT